LCKTLGLLRQTGLIDSRPEWSRGAQKSGNVLTAVKDRAVPIGRLFGRCEMFPGNLSMSRRLILPVLCALAVTLAAASGFARVGVVVGFAPPAPVVEAVPPPPAPGYVWQPGYWSWNGVQYVWVPGAYVVAPFVHAVWVPGAWVRRGPGWVWTPGHWRR
jgi:WXXGXW repeat (2 copies)